MTSSWVRTRQLFEEAAELSPDRRAGFLDQACGADHGLRARVQELLDADEEGDDFMEPPPRKEAAEVTESVLPTWTGRVLGGYRIARPLGAGGPIGTGGPP